MVIKGLQKYFPSINFTSERYCACTMKSLQWIFSKFVIHSMKKIIALFFCSALFTACKKDNADPEPPEISFVGFNYLEKDASGKDTKIEMIISFKDRNGDLGLRENEKKDQCGHDVQNLKAIYERNENGVFVPDYIPLDPPLKDTIWDDNCNYTLSDSLLISFGRSITYIEPEGNNKSIEGEISIVLDYSSDLILLKPSGRFKIYLVDRAGNKSNEIYTDELRLQQ
jgi:hypothetical protein